MQLAKSKLIQVRLWEELVHRNQFTALPHIILCFVSYGILFPMHQARWESLLAYAGVGIGCALRMGISKKFAKGEIPTRLQQLVFYLGSFFMGAGWASLFVFTHQHFGDYDIHTIYTFLLMAGFISGAVTTFSALPGGYYYFILPMSINTVVYAFYTALADPYAVTFCVGFYTLFHVNQIEMSHKYFLAYIENEIAITWERDKLRSFFNAVPGFVGRVDRDLIYQEVNDYRTDNFKSQDILGKRAGSFEGTENFRRFLEDFMASAKSTAVQEIESRVQNRRSTFIVSLQRIENPPGAVIVSIPMEELVEAREKVKAQEAKAIYTAKLVSLGEVAAGIAHEINNPLAIIMGSADQVLKQLARPEPQLEKVRIYAEKINSTIDRITNIIKSLKGLARNADRDPFQPCKFTTILEPCVEVTRQRFVEHKVQFEVKGAVNDVLLMGREVQLSQVMMNLINNAFDAAFEGPAPKWVRLHIDQGSEHVDIRIEDSGPGIPHGIRNKIMEPFFTTKPINKGTGLGLSISKSIIEEHGGHLTLAEDAANTTFVVRLRKAAGEMI